MSDIAIKIENLSKRYRYGAVSSRNDTLRADLTEWARGLLTRRNQSGGTRSLASAAVSSLPRSERGQPGGTRSLASAAAPVHSSQPGKLPSPKTDNRQLTTDNSSIPSHSPVTGHESLKQVHERHIAEDPNYFWALKDINLEVRQGEVVGIIGRNGAGKSTLLKILSRITQPSTGSITYNGRIASLLEVGTGFHRELTGRENIFLNGSILGMKRAEITKNFDEIVAFAEVEKFIDTPVKFYSSGMYVRLAFAVAAHLEPEILVVDEVLAVGDASFQKKCLGKMGDVARQGRTVLFVSHNMGAVLSLCSRVVLIAGGRISDVGEPSSVIGGYLRAGASFAERNWPDPISAPGDDVIRLRAVRITGEQGHALGTIGMDSSFEVQMEYEIKKPTKDVHVGFRLSASDGTVVLTTGDHDGTPTDTFTRQPGVYLARCKMPGRLLSPQSYYLSFGAHVPNVRIHFLAESALAINVERTHPLGSTTDDKREGIISPVLPWVVAAKKGDVI